MAFEALLAVFLLALIAVGAVPLYGDWQKEKRLEAAAEELAAAIREVEIEAKSESTLNTQRQLTFVCTMNEAERVTYFTRRGTRRIRPKGTLPEGITNGNRTVALNFQKGGLMGGNEEYTVTLKTEDGKYFRNIIVAAYTGRVRVEKVK